MALGKTGPFEVGDVIGDLVGVLTSTVTFGVDGALVYSTATDIDIILWDLPTITGTPRAIWDESSDAYSFLPNILTTVLYIAETTTPTAIDSHGAIYTKDNNELFFQDGAGNEHLLHGDAFSNMWWHSVSKDTVEIATANLFTLIDSFDNIGEQDDLGNVVSNTTTDEMTIGANGAGKYKITFHMSITSNAASSEMVIAIGIELATPLNITGATNTTPIVITSVGHGLLNGDMVTIDGCTGNDAADGDWIVTSKTTDAFTLISLAAANSVGNGVYNSGSGDVDIVYPGNLVIHRAVARLELGVGGANADKQLNASDKVALYVANIGATRDLEIAIVNMELFRIGD